MQKAKGEPLLYLARRQILNLQILACKLMTADSFSFPSENIVRLISVPTRLLGEQTTGRFLEADIAGHKIFALLHLLRC